MVQRIIDIWRLHHWVRQLLVTTALAGVTLVSCMVAWSWWEYHHPPVPPDTDEAEEIKEGDIPNLCGWAGEEVAREEFSRLKDQFIPFVIWDAAKDRPAASLDKRVVLWDAARKVLGADIPTFRQETGDCVSMGAANAVMYLQCVQIASGNHETFRPIFPPYIYGTSRVFIGNGRIPCRSAGSVGSWAADALQKYGAIASDADSVPSYSGAVADKWGCKPGPPSQFVDVAKSNLVESAAQVTTWEECRDAIVNGYPVTIASNQGFQMRGTVRDGKMWLSPSGSWAHQMCVIGYDNSPEPCFCILNSWGPKAHGEQTDGPQGAFWVKALTIKRIVSQGDSFAISGFKGFPKQNWDIDIMRGVAHVRSDSGGGDRSIVGRVYALGL